ncbi:hypothetical protein VTK26DRAFT_9398 [Humicola hyalothermophila]
MQSADIVDTWSRLEPMVTQETQCVSVPAPGSKTVLAARSNDATPTNDKLCVGRKTSSLCYFRSLGRATRKRPIGSVCGCEMAAIACGKPFSKIRVFLGQEAKKWWEKSAFNPERGLRILIRTLVYCKSPFSWFYPPVIHHHRTIPLKSVGGCPLFFCFLQKQSLLRIS